MNESAGTKRSVQGATTKESSEYTAENLPHTHMQAQTGDPHRRFRSGSDAGEA